jgi:hypothetical protein
MSNAIAALALTAVLASPVPASSQSCPPIMTPMAQCTAVLPGAGAAISGTVLQVIDSRTVCVALGPLPSQWVRLEISDAPERGSRGAMMASAFGRDVDCVIVSELGSSVEAHCIADGVSVGRSADSPDMQAQARLWP